MPDIVDRIADILIEDHIELMTENQRLREALAEVQPLVIGANFSKDRYPKFHAALGEDRDHA